MGVLQLEREREREREGLREKSYLEGKGMAIADSQHFFRMVTWSGGEKKAISYHNTLLIADCDTESERASA